MGDLFLHSRLHLAAFVRHARLLLVSLLLWALAHAPSKYCPCLLWFWQKYKACFCPSCCTVGQEGRCCGVCAAGAESAALQRWKPMEIPHFYWHNAKFKEIHPPWEQSVFNKLHWSESLADKILRPPHRGIQGLQWCLLVVFFNRVSILQKAVRRVLLLIK